MGCPDVGDDDTPPEGLDIDCVTGQAVYRPLAGDALDVHHRDRQAVEAEQQAQAAKQERARQVLADNPDLATVLRALGLSLPADPGDLRGEVR
jgi:hypothetical protein